MRGFIYLSEVSSAEDGAELEVVQPHLRVAARQPSHCGCGELERRAAGSGPVCPRGRDGRDGGGGGVGWLLAREGHHGLGGRDRHRVGHPDHGGVALLLQLANGLA